MSKRSITAKLLERIGATELMFTIGRHTPSLTLPILTFHRVHEPSTGSPYLLDDGVIDSTPEQFDRQMATIARYCTPVGIAELVRLAEGEPPPRNAVLITFDDGYRDNHEVALPILARHGIKAVFFIATSYITNRRLFWWDRINYLVKRSHAQTIELSYPIAETLELRTPADKARALRVLLRLVKTRYGLELDRFLTELSAATGVMWTDALDRQLSDETLMTWDQVRALRAAGMDIQSHTRTHRVLQTLADDQIVEELRGSRADLEHQLGEDIRAISYPVGDTIDDRPFVRTAVAKVGYKIGFTNDNGAQPLWRKLDPFAIRRIGIDRDTPAALFRAMLAMPTIFD